MAKRKATTEPVESKPKTTGTKCEFCGIIQGRGKKHKPGCSKLAGKPETRTKGDLLSALDGRTKTSVLLRLQARVEEILAEKDKAEVKEVKEALATVDKLRTQLAEAEALIS